VKYIKNILLALISGIVFLVFIFVLNLNIILSIVATVLIYISLILILPVSERKQGNYSDAEYENIQNTLRENKEKIREVCKDTEVLSGDIKKKVKKLCEISEQILENVKNNPQNMKSVKRVFCYYLETTDRILDIYTEISKQNSQSIEMEDRVKKVENTLDLIIAIFEQYIEKSVETKVIDLDVEIELLEKVIQMEE
jgi:5-bromo-4-chloroindolyl phosphate hydrolysis protein